MLFEFVRAHGCSRISILFSIILISLLRMLPHVTSVVKEVRANCYCVTSLLRTKFTRHLRHRARVLSSKVNMAIAIPLRGFNNLGRSVTPIFLSMGHFLYRFSTFCEKMKKIYRVEVWIFCRTLHRTPFIWPLRLAVRQFQGLRFMKMMSIFEIISATDSLIQNIKVSRF